MSEIKVEHGVPLPRPHNRYPFDDMRPGDSFFIAGVKARTILTAAAQYGKRHRGRFTVRKVEGGARCWCLEAPRPKAPKLASVG